MNENKPITHCRVCNQTELTPVLSLGNQFISDFVDEQNIKTGPRCPLDYVKCGCCGLVQLAYSPPQQFMFTRHYWYRSGVTQTMREELQNVVEDCLWRMRGELREGDIVLDIGSNDGTLLRSYPPFRDNRLDDPGEAIIDCDYMGFDRYDIVKVGVEPAVNLVQAGSKGVDILVNDFWNANSYLKAVKESRLEWGNSKPKAKIITAIGMTYDLEDPNQFIADVAKVLHPDGIFCAQLMCLHQTIDKLDLGNFAHEHIEFYSLAALRILLNRHGLEIYDVKESPANGGSYRVFACHLKSVKKHMTRVLQTQYGLERFMASEDHLESPDLWTTFSQEVSRGRDKVVGFIESVVGEGKTVWAFGASTKGNVILQYYGLKYPIITAAADKSPEKWGKYTVGTGIPIKNEEEFRAYSPDYALVLPYAFILEFMEREKEWLQGGGKFIVPLPRPHVIEWQGKNEAAPWLVTAL